MTDPARNNVLGILGIIGLGLLVGLANNLFAGDARRLDWVGAYPPKGEPPCKKHEADLASAAGVPTAVAPESMAAAVSEPVTEPGATPEVTEPVTEPGALVATADIPPIPAGQFWVELAPGQVKALFDQGALFIDARRTSVFEEGHIKGALSIPIWESGVDDKVAQVIFHDRVQGNVATPIVIYCNGGDCEDSHMVGDKLGQAGFTAAYVYKDGWPDWTKNAWPTATGGAQ